MGKAVFLILILSVVFYVLYQSGYLVISSKSAVSYIGSARGNGAGFVSCSGSVKRIVRFRADGTYTYILDAELSKGNLTVEMLDSDGQRVLYLDRANPRASIAARRAKKYCLIVRFLSATGKYTLTRE